MEKAAKKQTQRRAKNSLGSLDRSPWLDRALEVFGMMESRTILAQDPPHRRAIQPVAPSTMTLRRQKKPALMVPSSSSTTTSVIKGENKLNSSCDSSAAWATALAPDASASPGDGQHPVQPGVPGEAGRERGVESQADEGPGTADHDSRIIIHHTASEEGSERQGRQMNEQALYGTQQLHGQLGTSCRAIGPRDIVSGAGSIAAGSTRGPTNTTSRTERRLPRVILKVRPPPEAEAGGMV